MKKSKRVIGTISVLACLATQAFSQEKVKSSKHEVGLHLESNAASAFIKGSYRYKLPKFNLKTELSIGLKDTWSYTPIQDGYYYNFNQALPLSELDTNGEFIGKTQYDNQINTQNRVSFGIDKDVNLLKFLSLRVGVDALIGLYKSQTTSTISQYSLDSSSYDNNKHPMYNNYSTIYYSDKLYDINSQTITRNYLYVGGNLHVDFMLNITDKTSLNVGFNYQLAALSSLKKTNTFENENNKELFFDYEPPAPFVNSLAISLGLIHSF